MAIASVGSGGSVNDTSNSGTIALTTTASVNASDNHFALFSVSSDNTSTTDGDNSEVTGVSGGTGTWSKLAEYTNGQGSAAAGTTVALWLFVPSGANASGATFTATFTSNRSQRRACMWVFSKDSTTTIQLDPETSPQSTATDATNGFGSVSFSGLSSQERLYFRAMAKETGSATTLTASTNFTVANSLAGGAQIGLHNEFRINTSTGETSNPTLADSGDTSSVFVAIEELTDTQDLTPSLVTNTQSFFTPEVSQYLGELSPALFTNTSTFYSATVTAATTSLLPPLLGSTSEIYSPSVAGGAVAPIRRRPASTKAFRMGDTGIRFNLIRSIASLRNK